MNMGGMLRVDFNNICFQRLTTKYIMEKRERFGGYHEDV